MQPLVMTKSSFSGRDLGRPEDEKMAIFEKSASGHSMIKCELVSSINVSQSWQFGFGKSDGFILLFWYAKPLKPVIHLIAWL